MLPFARGKPGPSDAMAKAISLGETVIGVLLILGLFTGIAAFLAGYEDVRRPPDARAVALHLDLQCVRL